jgi:glycosyltransferase involved in cell wall biosynthesis
LLVGDIDENNPTCISKNILEEWISAGNVEFKGYQTNMAHIFKNSNLVCLPSYREGCPKSLLEAASTGRAIVTTNAPGCKELVIHGKTGYLVDVKEIKDLADKIGDLITNPDKRKAMGIEARKYMEQNFSTEIVNQQFLKAYNNLLAS